VAAADDSDTSDRAQTSTITNDSLAMVVVQVLRV
jgi:hypothetical protein